MQTAVFGREKHKSVALFSLIDLRSSDSDSDKHVPCLVQPEHNPEGETEAFSKQFFSF